MGPGDTRWRRILALTLVLAFGVAGVTTAILTGDLATALITILFVVLFLFASGPLMRWLRRGEGPHATSSVADADRATYVRLRHSGGNGSGR